jgi:hypothetical protein
LPILLLLSFLFSQLTWCGYKSVNRLNVLITMSQLMKQRMYVHSCPTQLIQAWISPKLFKKSVCMSQDTQCSMTWHYGAFA